MNKDESLDSSQLTMPFIVDEHINDNDDKWYRNTVYNMKTELELLLMNLKLMSRQEDVISLNLSKFIDDTTKNIDALNTVIAHKNQLIAQQNKNIQSNQQNIFQLQNDLKTMNNTVTNLENSVGMYNTTVLELENRVKKCNETIIDLETRTKHNESSMAEINKKNYIDMYKNLRRGIIFPFASVLSKEISA
ncbi:MAG: hypothetical protein Faunusvirus3_16 [Faunusvirus sp.]|jgi:septal ring factor EnvC (AmiA/AmiB activator)|uniref:Uncharacterized protein n=1 Tax=Faunusvirus sp. TaxID=2487766 RepID=A0A3G4ZW68_9VIRU|nr:MAG: hypothetical protein Faunusvirus3_16 [Faunusvirus sp.]